MPDSPRLTNKSDNHQPPGTGVTFGVSGAMSCPLNHATTDTRIADLSAWACKQIEEEIFGVAEALSAQAGFTRNQWRRFSNTHDPAAAFLAELINRDDPSIGDLFDLMKAAECGGIALRLREEMFDSKLPGAAPSAGAAAAPVSSHTTTQRQLAMEDQLEPPQSSAAWQTSGDRLSGFI